MFREVFSESLSKQLWLDFMDDKFCWVFIVQKDSFSFHMQLPPQLDCLMQYNLLPFKNHENMNVGLPPVPPNNLLGTYFH